MGVNFQQNLYSSLRVAIRIIYLCLLYGTSKALKRLQMVKINNQLTLSRYFVDCVVHTCPNAISPVILGKAMDGCPMPIAHTVQVEATYAYAYDRLKHGTAWG